MRVGSFGFVFLVWFRVSIKVRIWFGRGECLEFILPLGMWCLSADRMAFVRILLAVWGWEGGEAS